jgi:hypothetical protein
MSSVLNTPSPEFYVRELEQALLEQSGRIESFEQVSQIPNGASASVKLLEGPTVLVNLTSKGYKCGQSDTIRTRGPWSPPERVDEPALQTHETLDDLLRKHSPLWDQRTSAILMEKLQALHELQVSLPRPNYAS